MNKLTNSKSWNVFLIIAGIWSIATNNPETDPIWFFIGLFLLIIGSYRLVTKLKRERRS